MGRAALDWSAKQLAAAAGIGSVTVARFEGGATVSPDSITAMQTAMEANGVQFARRSARLVVSFSE